MVNSPPLVPRRHSEVQYRRRPAPTPTKDRYWAYVSDKDGLMKRWEFVLQNDDGSPGTGEPTMFTWEDWRDAGDGLLFARKHVKMGPGPSLAILFPEVKISKKVDESAFAPPTGSAK